MVLENECEKAQGRSFYKDDGGFSTVGMVLALLITLSLVFTTGQVYKIYSYSSRVQNVADACALAAENQVSSFYLAAQVCDAMVLTLSLTGVVAAGAGTVALCVPGLEGLGGELITAGKKIIQARDSFSRKAVEGLNAVQRMLPFIACAQAMGVARENNGDVSDYVTVAVLLPVQSQEIAPVEDDGAEGAIEAIDAQKDEIANAADEAERQAQLADDHKRRAWEADCGSAPYCMRERASQLASLSGASNPSFASPDTWSFSVALNRAKAYYAARLTNEYARGSSVDEQANSALRLRFYAYASRAVANGYVHETESSFEAYFPHLPGNTEEMRQTELYTEAVYPVTAGEGGEMTMHAWSGCPQIAREAAAGTGSVSQLDQGGFTTCPECRFTPSSLGSVAAATTSTKSGFEHYYRIVEEQAAEYQKARTSLEAASSQVKGPVEAAFEQLRALAESCAGARISPDPPGKYGAIALTADVGSTDSSNLLPNGFVTSGGVLGPRVALSAATLAAEPSNEGADVLNSLLDGVSDKLGIDAVLPGAMLDAWSALLRCYTQGYEGISQALDDISSNIPLVSAAGLGTWASGKFEEAVGSVGLEPVSVDAMKPVVVNSWHVAQADGGEVASGFMRAKRASAYLAQNEGNPYGALVDASMDYAQTRFDDNAETGVEIAVIELPFAGSLPIKLEVPTWVKTKGHDYLDEARSRLHELAVRPPEEGVWR